MVFNSGTLLPTLAIALSLGGEVAQAQARTLRNGCGVAPLRRQLSKDFSKGAGEVEPDR